MARKVRGRSTFGSIDRLPSGRYRARYVVEGVTYSAKTETGKPKTFDTQGDAEEFLAGVRTDIARKEWKAPATVAVAAAGAAAEEALTFRQFAERWMTTHVLARDTRDDYESMLKVRIHPTFGERPLKEITPDEVEAWYAAANPNQTTRRAAAYSFLKSIFETAVDRELILRNPCRIKGGSVKTRKREPFFASKDQVVALRAVMPPRYRAAIDLGAWGSLRIGEVIGLQRADVDLDAGTVTVVRSVGRVKGGLEIKAPKTKKSQRTFPAPPGVLARLREHLAAHVAPGDDAWLFPAAGDITRPVLPDVLREAFQDARARVKLPRLTFHGLRGSGATWYINNGASTREVQERLGHTTAAMALRYQRVDLERQTKLMVGFD